MDRKKNLLKPTYSFIFNNNLELNLKDYINIKRNKEISGGLLGDIKGGKKNIIIFDIKEFLPFPNLASDIQNFAVPPNSWFEILEEWRLFNFKHLKFIGFLHTHPKSSSKLSSQDKEFAKNLQEKYGSIVFIIIGENKYLRCYLFNEYNISLIKGELRYYKLLKQQL